jgi:cyclopropane fatty-acyl-phospholipid synthase-like methyltransferase
LYLLAKEEYAIRWRRIQLQILRHFPRFNGLKVVEIGAGAGTYAAMLARRGAEVTLLDYSPNALHRAEEFFSRLGLPAHLRMDDALALPDDLRGEFDVAMSFGLNEHFEGGKRERIAAAHLEVLKPGGLAFISVPNQWCLPYRLFKFAAQRTGKWIFGEEYPFTRLELEQLGQRLGAKEVFILADSLMTSFDFINPFKALAVVRTALHLHDDYNSQRLRPEHGTPLDTYLSYALVLGMRKAT